MPIFNKVRWGLLDCLTGARHDISHLPFEIGRHDAADLRLNGEGLCERHCAVAPVENFQIALVKRDPEAVMRVNGGVIDVQELEPHLDYTLQVGGHFLLLRGSSNLNQWHESLDCQAWSLYDPQTQESHGPFALADLGAAARQHQVSPQTVATPHGAGMGFYLRHLLVAFGEEISTPTPPPLPGSEHGADFAAGVPNSHGAFTCPVCWLKFDTGDIMSVAVHD